MAIINFKSAAARLAFETGMSDEGKVMRKTKTYQNIAQDVDVDDFYNGLQALASLSTYPVLEMDRIETSSVRK